jgi:hypothetical protein
MKMSGGRDMRMCDTVVSAGSKGCEQSNPNWVVKSVQYISITYNMGALLPQTNTCKLLLLIEVSAKEVSQGSEG